MEWRQRLAGFDSLEPVGPALTCWQQTGDMKSKERSKSHEGLVKPRGSLAELAAQAKNCKNCDLWRNATQTVFGEGSSRARIMLVGEVPGNEEDQQGRPFVGPAGKLMDRLLAEIGIDRRKLYVTNAVKHFKWEERGKRRLHKKPTRSELLACVPWLEAEIDVVRPSLVVLLGSTAVEALLGPGVRVLERRGVPIETPSGRLALPTVHPSSVLRAKDDDRARQYDLFVADLRVAAELSARR